MLFPETLFGWVISIGAAVLICLLLLPEDGGQPRPPPAEDAAAADAGAPTCRICYAGAEAGRLFSPCLCSGTMAHVHVSCLNEWRKQSVNPRSLYTCDACGYSYRLQRTAVADALQSERCVWLASTLLVGLLVAVGAAVPVPTELWLYDAARWSPRAEVRRRRHAQSPTADPRLEAPGQAEQSSAWHLLLTRPSPVRRRHSWASGGAASAAICWCGARCCPRHSALPTR